MPAWVSEGFQAYQKRLTKPWQLDLLELTPQKNKLEEAALILAKVDVHDFCVALDVLGKPLSTEALSQKLPAWQQAGKHITFLIGGHEGLDASCIKRANFSWSLSNLTFPHQLVKVMLAEQLYRAVSILNGHPYHRS